MNNLNQAKKKLLKEISWSISSIIGILSVFFVLVIFLRFVFNVPFSLWINFWILVWGLILPSFIYIAKKQKEISVIYDIHFIYFIFQLLMLTIILHYVGGIEWIGVIFYIFFIVYGIFLLPKKRSLTMVLIAILFFFLLAFLEYFGIISHYDLFGESNFYLNFNYILSFLLITAAIILLLYFVVNRFAEKIRNQNIKLTKIQGALFKTNIRLEEKLQELREKSKELEEKKELAEKFNKLSVGRELKMIELKKEVEILKKLKNRPPA